jgi:hypothetical protein
MNDILEKGATERQRKFDGALVDVSLGIQHIVDMTITSILECAKLRAENARLRRELEEAQQELVDVGVWLDESEIEYDNALEGIADD